MLTLFACPKAFSGGIGINQLNAITSWTKLEPKPEIIFFGDEEGISEICKEFKLHYVPELRRNEFGTPLVNDLFEKAKQLAHYDLICYVNADIILTQSFFQALDIVQKKLKRFIISCSNWEMPIKEEINFHSLQWQEEIFKLAQEKARRPVSLGMDLFLFQRGTYQDIPPFAIGRTVWDNWLIFKARSLKIPLVDISQFTLTIHPDHENSTHTSQGKIINTSEGATNRSLVNWWARTFIGRDANYVLEADGQLRKKESWELLWPRMQALKLAPPIVKLRQEAAQLLPNIWR